MKKILHHITSLALVIVLAASLSSCANVESGVHDMNGSITGHTYNCQFYTNDGEEFMDVTGSKIDMNANVVKEYTYTSDGGWGVTKTMSSVVTITVDGKQINNCGSTVIFAEEGLEPDVDFQVQDIHSTTDGSLGENPIIAKTVNSYKNAFGKPVVVVIQSQLGDPICAYSGKNVYWEVCQNLPKTTKLMIDGRALYIHRANFQTIDKALLD